MVSMVKDRRENDVVGMLIYAQKYQIKSLISTCIFEARRLTLKELTQHGMRDQIEEDNYVQIAEGIIQRLEEKLEKCRGVKVTLQSQMTNVCRSLCSHRGLLLFGYCQSTATGGFLDQLKGDTVSSNRQCNSLSDVAKSLSDVAK